MADIFSAQQTTQFIEEGFLRIDSAFPAELAEEARNMLWGNMPEDPHNPATWTRPVVRLGMFTAGPFVKAANTPLLHQAFDELAGPGKWLPCMAMGTFPVRFPSPEDPGDAGWHVDASFPGQHPDNFVDWRVNVRSKNRALLMLFLFSDVGEQDAPTRIRKGSHLDVAKLLQPAGEQGLSFMEIASRLDALPAREEVLATGKAGTVYLCHPFIAHAAQPHRGKEPRFLAQPPLLLKKELDIEKPATPVEMAIHLGLTR
ncbi:phytanoyl-CoA dioxygenase family protein [Chitinophaga alhagiae]|uniref:phytanoyl-CoA dioxygenase family protein n=1 Tax=Chitinophaga alhagiae TaxID=2203219 RepID=UPI000E5B34B1|nr:phytanoyl-CoA dioxygenase family protein [Chitinophaga alhagiae]